MGIFPYIIAVIALTSNKLDTEMAIEQVKRIPYTTAIASGSAETWNSVPGL